MARLIEAQDGEDILAGQRFCVLRTQRYGAGSVLGRQRDWFQAICGRLRHCAFAKLGHFFIRFPSKIRFALPPYALQ